MKSRTLQFLELRILTENPIQDFKVLQKNAEHFQQNSKNAQRMMSSVEEAGAFKPPADNGGRSFKPTFGPTEQLEGVDSQYVRSKGWKASMERGDGGEGHEHLLKQVRPAYGNGKFESALTLDPKSQKFGAKAQHLLKNQALQLENLILKQGPVATDTLLKKITGLKKLTDKYKNLTDTNWITQTYKKKFVIEGGQVKLRPPKVRDIAPDIPEDIAPVVYQPPPPMDQKGKSLFAALMRKSKDEKAARLAAAG